MWGNKAGKVALSNIKFMEAENEKIFNATIDGCMLFLGEYFCPKWQKYSC